MKYVETVLLAYCQLLHRGKCFVDGKAFRKFNILEQYRHLLGLLLLVAYHLAIPGWHLPFR